MHKAGFVVGDMNPENIGVKRSSGQIQIFDCDSFTIPQKSFRTNVCQDGFLAPEIIKHCKSEQAKGKPSNLDTVALPTFTKESDLFCLAIHIFRALMNGIHPFLGVQNNATGSQKTPFVGNVGIERNNYVFRQGLHSAAVYCLKEHEIPLYLKALFNRAFIDGYNNPHARPSAREWYEALSKYLTSIKQCSNNSKHQYYKTLSYCPYCQADENHYRIQYRGASQPKTYYNSQSIPKPIIVPKTKLNKRKYIIAAAAFIGVFILIGKTNNKEHNNTPTINPVQSVENSQKTVQKTPPLTQAQIREAINYYNDGNYSRAIPVLQRATYEQHHAEAEYYYARALKRGDGIKKDINAAVKHYENSASNGYYAAYNSLGVIYRDVYYSCEDNKKTAFYYFKKGAEYDDLYALFNFTQCIATGSGTEQNISNAIISYKYIAEACKKNLNGLSRNTANKLREESLDNLITIVDSNYSFSTCTQLAQYLTNGLQNNEDKIYVLFHWITTNISYDTTYRIYDSENTYRYRKGVCAGYSLLLKQMCEAVGILCEFIVGYTTDSSGRIDYSERHAWSRIYTGERYIYCDSTWAAGSVQNGTFVRCYEGKWWDSEYEIFSKTHIPE